MKKSLLFVFGLVFLNGQCTAQNLLSNGDFETYTVLPSSSNYNWNLATGWSNCNGSGSPDYAHTFGTGVAGLPNNWEATVYPHGGNGIMGFLSWHNGGTYREYLSHQLISPLIIGQTYKVSFWLTNGIPNGAYGGYGTDHVGAVFSNSLLQQPGWNFINYPPKYAMPAIFYDSLWKQFTFQFVADSAYRYITIGNFVSDATMALKFYSTQGIACAYYFIDDIEVVQLQSTKPVPAFTSSDTTFCNESGNCIDFFDQSTNNPTSWKWFFPGAVPDTSTQQNPTNICYYNPGTYAVKLIVSNSNGSDSLTVSSMITFATSAAAPVLTFSGDTIYCSHAVAYQWYFNGSPIANATDSFYVETGDGVYAVQITDGNGCTRLSSGFAVAVNEVSGVGGIKVYPNPAKNELWVVSYGFEVNSRATIEINNVLGDNVYRTELVTQNPKPKTKIDISSLAKGIYIVTVGDGEKTYRTKILKQ